MNTLSKTTAIALTALLLSAAAAFARVEVKVSSQFLVKGEQALVEYVIPGRLDPRARLRVPEVDGLSIRPLGMGPERRLAFNRRPEYVFRYTVTSYEPGIYQVPSATVEIDGDRESTDAFQIRIFDETELEWSSVDVGGQAIRYAATLRSLKDIPFVKEVVPTELKLYFPADQTVEDWGIPDVDRDGVAAWRFEPKPSIGRANLLGSRYYAVSYPSTLSATREGPVQLGPAKLRLITVQRSIRDFGSAFYAKTNLTVPALELEARALPEGAPEGFEDAVGKFELSVTAAETEVREGDPINVNVIVSGTGNLDTLDCPQPISSEGWKLYPPSSVDLSERRAISGAASFRQFMRPLVPQPQIPPFRLVYFDPDEESYVRLLSEPIALDILPSTRTPGGIVTVPPARGMPIEEMTDILGLVDAGGRLLPAPDSFDPFRWWQLVPAAIALILLGLAFRLHLAPKLRRDPVETARRRAFRALEKAPSDQPGFYRAAGQFIERWLGDRDDDLVRDVLAKRDQTCFTHDVPSEKIKRSERQRILRELRRIALPLVALAALLAVSPARAEEAPDPRTAYEEGRYGEAAEAWLDSGPYEQLPADTLYNIGNAAYRLGVPGEAALYWRRALARDATHAEARQNLRFFERKFGSITIERPEYQYTIAKLPLSLWKNLMWGGAWLAGLGLLVFPATHPMSRLRIAAVAALVTAPLVSGTGFCGWYYYPDDARFAPLAEQGVVVVDRASVRTDAARNAPLVIEAPAGSLCRVLKRSGDWAYIAFTNDTRGWVSADTISLILPDGTPDPPTFTNEPDNGRSA
ncbi:hypothetical protein [Haloferula sp. A504]|uniref:hypothetical protein n=1 Tax=Haloferula sp. A504 TaxID=3373601 RepID=UPI0031BDC90A|nr:hypothetical protein [Verrucomicrobiaceae bacterium E54]